MKIKSETDCATGRDYFELARANDWSIRKNGSYYEIHDQEGNLVARFPDSNRCLPKETRMTINTALVKAGLLIGLLAMVMAWVM